MGTKGTAGFIIYRVIYGSGTGSTRCGYGMSRYGYGVGKPDPWVTRSKPYARTNSELRMMFGPKALSQALSKSLSDPAMMMTRLFSGTGWPFSKMPKICSDNFPGDGNQDEMVDRGDIVEVRCGLGASGSTSTIGAGIQWIAMRTLNVTPFKCSVRYAL